MDEENNKEKIIPQVIEDEMKRAYLDYAMSVIVGRALPDVRDGLKPVHRRILYAMNDMGMRYNTASKKCARIVGEVLGKYHPHGDQAVYDSLVRMAQEFSLRYPLIKGQGNFGSLDGDNAAAMRYCVTGDTLINTDKGILPIDCISNKEEEDIRISVQDYQGKTQKAVKFFNSGKHKIYQILTVQNYELKGSANHPILCWTVDIFGVPKHEWKLLSELSEKDYVLLSRTDGLFRKTNLPLQKFKPKTKKKEKNILLPKEMTSSISFLLGALVAEGSSHQKKFIFNNKDINFYNAVKKAIYDNFTGIKLYERKIAGNCRELEIYHQKVVRFLQNIGLEHKKSDAKEIPFSVLQSKKAIIKYFLVGLFEGDGSVLLKTDMRHGGKSIELTYNSKSKKLITQLKIVLLNFGIATTAPYTDKRNGCYKLIISGVDNIDRFQKEIGFFSKKKKDRLATIKGLNKLRMSKTDNIPFLNNYLRDNYAETFIQKNNFDRYNLLEKNYEKLIKIIKPSDKKLVDWIKTKRFFFNRIKRINVLPAENVYSIKVNSACHSFVGNGFINHNTEAKLSKISDEILSEIGQDTVDFTENFDGTLKEPQVLPSKIPNLLVNGSSGIAVGMATSIPPHNLSEVCKGVIQLIEQPDTDVVELIKIIKGPDFPTGGIITGTSGFVQAYHSGRGRIRVKSVIDIEERKNKRQIVIKEIPYMVNKSLLVEEIANRIREKRIEGVSDLRDESDKDGVRVILELRGSANVDVVKNQLLKTTRAQDTFSMILLSLVNNEPKILTLKQMLQEFLSFRQQVVRRRTEFELKKAQSRAHIIEGIIICLDNIEDVVELIKKSRSADEAKKGLNTKYDLSEKQCQAVLDMKLQRLTGLEQEKLRQELKDLLERIKELKEILASETKIFEIIKTELQEMISKYGDDRRTSIEEGDDEDIDIEDLIVEEEQVVTLSNQGYIKRLPDETYRVQRRGGKGKIGAIHDEDDFIEKVFIANTHLYLLCFSDRGKVHWLKVYKIPEASRYGKGKAIVNLVELPKGEKITQVIPVKEFKEGNYLMMATKKGIIKKSALNAYSKPRHGGIRAINLAEDDELIGAVLGDETQYIMLATSDGRAVRFTEKSIRSIGRTGKGVRGIKVRGNDYVVGMVLASEDDKLFTMTENGYGKRTNISEYRLINRGGSGVRNIICSPRNGKVVTVKAVNDTDEIILMSKKGIALRIAAGTISTIGRNTQGMRIMKLGSGDRVVSTALIPGNGEAEE